MPFEFYKKQLYCPNKEELVEVLKSELQKSYMKVDVTLVDCPDLTQVPFNLSSTGLCGDPSIADIGGVSYLLPVPNHSKIYGLKEIAGQMGYKKVHLIGAGAAPSHIIGNLAELIVDLSISENGFLNNNSHLAQTDDQGKSFEIQKINNCCEANHLVNIFASKGNSGPVLRIQVTNRISKEGFVECLQKILFEKYGALCGDSCLGLGGVILLNSGVAKIHIMPPTYSTEPLVDKKMVDNWLRFFEMKSPLTCLGYLVSHDPGMNLRTEHFHCWNLNGAGGHFHHDITPSDVSYTAYFNIPETIFRFDSY